MRVLIIEDHPLFADACKKAVIQLFTSSVIDVVSNSASALAALEKSIYDAVIADLSLVDDKKSISSGLEMVTAIKKLYPNTRLVILTSLNEKLLLYSIVKEVNPEGLLIKNEIDLFEFQRAIRQVINGERSYSGIVREIQRSLKDTPALFDSINRNILSLLAQGVKTKNLTDHIPLSKSAIDKRKSILKECFSVSSTDDLIEISRRLGYV